MDFNPFQIAVERARPSFTEYDWNGLDSQAHSGAIYRKLRSLDKMAGRKAVHSPCHAPSRSRASVNVAWKLASIESVLPGLQRSTERYCSRMPERGCVSNLSTSPRPQSRARLKEVVPDPLVAGYGLHHIRNDVPSVFFRIKSEIQACDREGFQHVCDTQGARSFRHGAKLYRIPLELIRRTPPDE